MPKRAAVGSPAAIITKNTVLVVAVFTLSSALMFIWGFASSQLRIFPYNLVANSSEHNQHAEDQAYEADLFWAERIRDGGFLLHIRHAQREKWNDVVTFDALEVLQGLRGENESFSRAVCLTPQGLEEATAIGIVLELTGVEVSQVWSSPSCRARQTAINAFGFITSIDNSLIHRSAIPRKQWPYFDNQLRSMILSLPSPGKANHVLVGHGSTLGNPGSEIIDQNSLGYNVDDRDETGFAVLEIEDDSVVVRHVFRSLRNYSQAALDLPLR